MASEKEQQGRTSSFCIIKVRHRAGQCHLILYNVPVPGGEKLYKLTIPCDPDRARQLAHAILTAADRCECGDRPRQAGKVIH